MNIEVKKSPYTSKLGGDIDITFSTDIEWLFNTVAKYEYPGPERTTKNLLKKTNNENIFEPL